MENQKRIGRYISIRMGITMCIVMSIVGSLMGALSATRNSKAPFFAIWIPSLLLSLLISNVIAFIIGILVPMKKVNDAIETKTKAEGIKLRVLQMLASDAIYTIIIATAMAFVSTAVFAYPNAKKSVEDANLIMMWLTSLAKSIVPEYIFAFIAIMIVEPIIQKKAIAKYIKGNEEK